MSYISKFKKTTSWRKQVLRSLVTDVILYEKIETSLSLARHKSKSNLTKLLAKLITLDKRADKKAEEKDKTYFYKLALGCLINKKGANKLVEKKEQIIKKLFKELAKRYKERPGGYSKIIKLNNRLGDNNQRVIFALV